MGKHTVGRGEARLRTGRCVDCGATTTPHTYTHSTRWYVPKFCPDCIRYRLRLSLLTVPRIVSEWPWASEVLGLRRRRKAYRQCAGCATVIRVTTARRKWCSNACQMATKSRLHFMTVPWDSTAERHRENARRRRYGLRAGEREWVGLKRIFKRDQGRCAICRRLVSLRRRSPDPLSPSLDHIVPVSLGGGHNWKNLRLTHRRCNLRRARKPAQLLLLTRDPTAP